MTGYQAKFASESAVVAGMGALAHPTRFAAFRRLVHAGPEGMAAGEAARLLNVPHNTLSGHLAELEQAGLVCSRRAGRSIIYSADLDGLAKLVGFLVEDCCEGRPELCGDSHPLLARIADQTRRARNPVESPVRNVLILCTGNSARSILAEAILNRMGAEKFRAFSAGSNPKGEVHPEARALLARLGYDVSWLRSKSWSEFARPGSPEMDFVFTVCDSAAGESCPVWPGHPMTAHWGIPDPAAAEGSPAAIRAAFEAAYRLLHERIAAFVALPFETLDSAALQRRLREIGTMAGATHATAALAPDVAE